MPLVLEPNKRNRIVLESDKSKPFLKQPYFIFRVLNCREAKKMVKIADSVYEDEVTGEGAIDKLIEAINISLIGWGNMIDPESGKEIIYDPKINSLDLLITMPEAQELMTKIQSQGIEESEIKDSGSPSD